MARKFYLYKTLCELASNSRVTKENCSSIVEIDAEENKNLVDHIGKKKFNKNNKEN